MAKGVRWSDTKIRDLPALNRSSVMSLADRLYVEHFFDEATATLSYLLLDRKTLHGAIIDSVQGFDPHSGRSSLAQADAIESRVKALRANIQWILETHMHADHLSAAQHLKSRLDGRIGIGANIGSVQCLLGDIFNAGNNFARDGSQFDHLFKDGEIFSVGSLQVEAWHTPGHTPACTTYVVTVCEGAGDERVAFVGDTLFMPDYGTARCDFPGGDARMLYRSIKRVLAMPDDTILYKCHDYRPGGRELQWMSTVREQRDHNVHVHDGVDERAFVALRCARDATLATPALMLPSVQVNMNAGAWPAPESDGVSYLKIPVNVL